DRRTQTVTWFLSPNVTSALVVIPSAAIGGRSHLPRSSFTSVALSSAVSAADPINTAARATNRLIVIPPMGCHSHHTSTSSGAGTWNRVPHFGQRHRLPVSPTLAFTRRPQCTQGKRNTSSA